MSSSAFVPASRVANIEHEGAYAVLEAAQALERQGRSIVHLEIGQPGFSTPKHIETAGISAIIGGITKYAPRIVITRQTILRVF